MDKKPLIWKCLTLGIILLFVCGALLPACSAQTNILQTDEEKMFLELPIKKVKQINDENESFFTYALIWGTFEENWYSSLFTEVHVFNRGPWYNRTMNVIGYQSWTGNWTVKKAFYVKYNFLHLGIVGRNWLCVIGIRNVDAF
jgi:hypothetical protein